jgi:hypothetical protein
VLGTCMLLRVQMRAFGLELLASVPESMTEKQYQSDVLYSSW